MLLHSIHNHVSPHHVLNQTTLWILTILSTSKPLPYYIKNKWTMDTYVTFRKVNYRRVVCFLHTQHLILHTFSTSCVQSVSYFALRQDLKYLLVTGIIRKNTHFSVTTMYNEFQSSTECYHKDNPTLRTTYNIQLFQSTNNCLLYTQVSLHEINEICMP